MVQLNEQNFQEETSEGTVLVDFFAHWCGPCKVIAPVLEKLEGIKVCKVNIDEEPELTSKFKIAGIPALIFMKEGVEVARMVGARPQNVIQEKVDEVNAL
jgi:thioredoxin 1